MGESERRRQLDERGASEVLGAVLLIGMVLTGALVAAYLGSSAVGSVRENQDSKSTKIAMQEVDSRLSTLATSSSATVSNFEFGETVRGDPTLVTDEGYLRLTVNEYGACSVEEPLDSIRLENDAGETVAYEAGGTWVLTENNGTVLRTAPQVSYRNGSIDVSLLDMTGIVEGGVNRAEVDTESSRRETTNALNTLLQGECIRPDNVTLSVKSDFYRAWAGYLAEETGLEPDESTPDDHSELLVDEADRTVTLFLNQSALPRRTNDNINNVVNVSGSDYMAPATITDNGIAIDKGVNNTYTVYASPITEDIEMGSLRIVEGDGSIRPPMDVVFVVDESGSMAWDANTEVLGCDQGDYNGGCQRKSEAVREAMQNFTKGLNSSRDRVGLVGFQQYHSNRGEIYRTNGRMLTTDFTTFNSSTVEKTGRSGGTYTAGGTKKGMSILGLKSNETRSRAIIMLTDGVNNDDDWWVDATEYDGGVGYTADGETFYSTNAATVALAQKGSQVGMDTYVVGFGSESYIDEAFLNATAAVGGTDRYRFADNTAELTEVFNEIRKSISSTEQVAHRPMTTNLSANGTLQPPQITGDTGNIASVTTHGKKWLNVNDPTAPSTFSHSFAISGGDMVNFSATTYDCEEGTWQSTGLRETVNGTDGIPVTRCGDIDENNATTIAEENVTVFTQGDTAEFNDYLDNTTTADWQENLSDAVIEYGGIYNGTSSELTLRSNQVLVLYDFPDGKNTDNRMLMVYSVGLSEEAARPSGIIDLDIDNVEIES